MYVITIFYYAVYAITYAKWPLQIVTYEGTHLIEGRDDGILITLHRDVR